MGVFGKIKGAVEGAVKDGVSVIKDGVTAEAKAIAHVGKEVGGVIKSGADKASDFIIGEKVQFEAYRDESGKLHVESGHKGGLFDKIGDLLGGGNEWHEFANAGVSCGQDVPAGQSVAPSSTTMQNTDLEGRGI